MVISLFNSHNVITLVAPPAGINTILNPKRKNNAGYTVLYSTAHIIG